MPWKREELLNKGFVLSVLDSFPISKLLQHLDLERCYLALNYNFCWSEQWKYKGEEDRAFVLKELTIS